MTINARRVPLEFLIWPTRRARSIVYVDGSNRDTVFEAFADHVFRKHQSMHKEAVLSYIEAFFDENPSYEDWVYAALGFPNDGVIWNQGKQPSILLRYFRDWRLSMAYVDADTLLISHLCRAYGDSIHKFAPEVIIGHFPNWRSFPRAYDPHLADLIQRGISDTHIHLEAGDPIADLWARLLVGWDRLDGVQRYAKKTLRTLEDSDLVRFQRRLNEKRYIEQALSDFRKDYTSILPIRRTGVSASLKTVPPDTATLLKAERTAFLTLWLKGTSPTASLVEKEKLSNYVYGKSIFLREQQQFPGSGAGLFRFREYLDRIETHQDSRRKRRPGYMAYRNRRLAQGSMISDGLRNVEFRIAPRKSARDYYRFFKIWKKRVEPILFREGQEKTEVRFTIHFIREPKKRSGTHEFEVLRDTLDKKSCDLHLFRVGCFNKGGEYQKVSELVTGIDVANLERRCPPYVFSPYLELLRGNLDALKDRRDLIGISRWKSVFARTPNLVPTRLPKLQLTYHAGEDFFHWSDGARHIHELASYCMETGDRIGHGVALAVDPIDETRMAARNTDLPAGKALDNLVWCFKIGSEEGFVGRQDRYTLRREIHQLATKIYGKDIPIHLLEELQKRRYQPPSAQGAFDLSEVDMLFGAETFDGEVRQRRKKTASRDTLLILGCIDKFAKDYQKVVTKLLRAKGIVIESNPTSNLATGAVQRMRNHPILKFSERNEVQGLVSINTDDPGLFATRLDNEYAIILNALRDKDPEDHKALEVLEGIRRTGNRSSFVSRLPDFG